MRLYNKLLLILAICLTSNAYATLLTTDVGYTGPGLDLSAYENGSYNFTFGPISLPGGITFTAAPGGGGNSGLGSVVGQGGYGLSGNGSFGGDAVYIGVDSGTGYADLTFDTELSSFGGFFNYAQPACCGWDAPTISALDSGGAVLETWDLSVFAPISTPGGFNEFAFRGIDLGGDSFKTFRIGGSYILMTGTEDGGVIDAPEPSILMLFAIGLIGLSLSRKKLNS